MLEVVRPETGFPEFESPEVEPEVENLWVVYPEAWNPGVGFLVIELLESELLESEVAED